MFCMCCTHEIGNTWARFCDDWCEAYYFKEKAKKRALVRKEKRDIVQKNKVFAYTAKERAKPKRYSSNGYFNSSNAPDWFIRMENERKLRRERSNKSISSKSAPSWIDDGRCSAYLIEEASVESPLIDSGIYDRDREIGFMCVDEPLSFDYGDDFELEFGEPPGLREGFKDKK